MKTIEEKAIEYCSETEENGYKFVLRSPFESFKAGVEFAQRWIPINRCTNGYITTQSLSDIERNLPVIMDDEDGVKDDEYVIIKYVSDLLEMDESFTHWRPINLK